MVNFGVFLFLSVSVGLVLGQLEHKCELEEYWPSNCINIKKCEHYLSLVREATKKPAVAKKVKDALCGFDGRDPKVCCPKTVSISNGNISNDVTSNPEHKCELEEYWPSNCINIKKCDHYLSLVREATKKPAVAKKVKDALCGFDGRDPKVCCPKPVFISNGNTPNNVTSNSGNKCELKSVASSCINIKKCEHYMKLLREFEKNPGVAKVLRDAQCGKDGRDPMVCCPQSGVQKEEFRSITTTTSTPLTTISKDVADKSGRGEDFVAAFPEPPVCGFSNATFNRIIGGVKAKLGDFPWMALIGYKNKFSWNCGGSLVTEKHVLTAAHCVHGMEHRLHIVRLGELDYATDDDGAAPVDIFIKRAIKHELYNSKVYTDDIAILVLQQEVQFSDLIHPICLPLAAELRALDFEDFNPLVAGWGYTVPNGLPSSHLRVVQLTVQSEESCKDVYRRYPGQVIDDRVLCTGHWAGGKDTGKGDSGGPLMQPIQNSRDYKIYMYEIGSVSYGIRGAKPGYYGVYSRITYYLPWLEQNILGYQ